MRPIRRSLAERVLARVVTGAAGHLYGGLLDLVEALIRWKLRRPTS